MFSANPVSVGPFTSARSLRTLRESVEARDLASFLYAADQRLGRASMSVPFEALTAEARDKVVERAAIAICLGDPVKALAVGEHAALGIVRDIGDRIRRHQLRQGDPEVALGLPEFRRLARVALQVAFRYLGAASQVRG